MSTKTAFLSAKEAVFLFRLNSEFVFFLVYHGLDQKGEIPLFLMHFCKMIPIVIHRYLHTASAVTS